MEREILVILGISVAGPILGSFLGVVRKPSEKLMYTALAFAGGVMLSISFLELIPESIELSSTTGCAIGILIGVMIMFLLDKLIPHVHPEFGIPEQGNKLKKTAIYLIFGIFLHNIPEGMAIALGEVPEVGVNVYVIALAIAIHNIPEGICTSAPYYHTSKKRLKSFLISSSTAIPIVIGFIVASILYKFISESMIGVIAGATAGLMIYITSDEIIPTSCSQNDHKPIFSLIFGILFVILLKSVILGYM